MITLFSSTNRPDNNSSKISFLYQKILKEKGLEAQILSFEDLPRDIAFSETFGQRSLAFKKIIDDYIAGVERFIFIVPEYNGSFPGILKVFLDSVEPKNW